jgi:hypothetical protein
LLGRLRLRVGLQRDGDDPGFFLGRGPRW